MKALIAFVMLIALSAAGCGTTSPIRDAYDRFALVSTEYDFGSATCVGQGLFITAKHVIKDDSLIHPFLVVNPEGTDSTATIVFEGNDIVILKSRLGIEIPPIEISYDPMIGENIVFIHPIPGYPINSNLDLNALVSHISRVVKEEFTVDRPIFPGCSGSGVFTNDGALVGICVSYQPAMNQIALGKAARLDTVKYFLDAHRGK